MDLASLSQLGDCEAIHEGWLAQPVNAWSSLAFGVVGLAIAASAGTVTGRERTDRLVFALLLVATGIGSFLFHGPQPAAGQYLHDVTFLAVLWFLGAVNIAGAFGLAATTGKLIAAAGIAVIAGILAISPEATNVLAAVLAISLIATDVVLWRVTAPDLRWYATAIVVLILGVGFFLAGRTGSPLCDSEGLLQGHAGWHIGAAVFLGSYFLATMPARTRAVA